MTLPKEATFSFDISFHPAQTGTKQFLEREQAVHKLYQNRKEPEKDFDLATIKKQAAVVNPGLVLSFDLGVGDKKYKFNLDNTNSDTILNVKESDLPSSAQKAKEDPDVLEFAKGKLTVTKYTDTCSLSSLSIPNFPFSVISGDGAEVQKVSDADGVIGNFPDADRPPMSGFAEYMLATTVSLTYKQASAGEDTQIKFKKGIIGMGDLPPSVSDTVVFTAPALKTSRKQYCDDLPFYLDLSYGSDPNDSEMLQQKGIAIWDHIRTFIMFPSDLFEKYRVAVGAEVDEKTGLLTITEEKYRKMKSLFFHIGQAKHELVPNAQIWPRDLNSVIGGEQNGKIYLSIADSGVRSGRSFDIVLGYAFLQRFHLVVDAPNDRLGFGPTASTREVIN